MILACCNSKVNSLLVALWDRIKCQQLKRFAGMATVHDVAAYILSTCGALSAMKLQKLVYYSQAWSLVWDEEPLFNEKIEAWANGPVAPELYKEHRGQYKVHSISKGNPQNLKDSQRETVDKVLEFYGEHDSQWLSDLTHMEDPWLKARKSLAPGERGSQEVTLESMAEYYGSL